MTTLADDALLRVEGLRTEIRRRDRVVRPVDGVSFTINRGETVGLVGESGSGKTMTAMSVLGLLPPGGRITAGSITLHGRDLTILDDGAIRRVRGRDVAMVFQDPMTSLNPTMTVADQISGPLRVHRGLSKAAARRRAEEMLGLVGLPRPAERLDDYPHQLSGGMRQRVMIAMALACEPSLLIADEPTTALDVTIQAQILELLDSLRRQLDMGVLLVTHDLGVIAGRADRVLVMYGGRIAESATTGELFARPRHPYTEALLRAIPTLAQSRDDELFTIPGMPPDLAAPPPGCRFSARCGHATDRCRTEEPSLVSGSDGHAYACFHPRPAGSPRSTTAAALTPPAARPEAETGTARAAAPGPTGNDRTPVLELLDVRKTFPITTGVLQRRTGSVHAVNGVSLTVYPGETFGLVGESGCGKTTLGRLIVGLERADSGAVRLGGADLREVSRGQLRNLRRDAHLMFQDPYASLNPRMQIGAALREPLWIHRVGSRLSRRKRVDDLLTEVGLTPAAAVRYPHEFSGGQRQRIGFARALALRPRLIVADEPVSALDVSIQSQILNLMRSLQRELGLAYVVISHDLSVVRYLADRIGVMYLGKLVETGPAAEVYAHPAHPYTAGLLEAVPVPDPQREAVKRAPAVTGELPSATDPPSGCPFRTRCPKAVDRCAAEEPRLRDFGHGQHAACHIPLIPPLEAPPVASSAPQPT